MRNFTQVPVFTSMPFGNGEEVENEWSRLFEAIKQVESLAAEDPLYGKLGGSLLIDRADKGLESLGLRENVKFKMELSSILLVVIVPNPPYPAVLPEGCPRPPPSFNANIMWEIGYAECKRMPIVYLVDRSLDIRELPAMVGTNAMACYFDLNDFKPEVPPDALKGHQARLARKLWPFLNRAIRDIETLKHFPVTAERFEVTAFSSREASNLRGSIESARRSVDIITTNLEYFADLLGPSPAPGVQWSSPFHTALRNGARIRLLTMNPDCHIAELRANQLDRKGDVHAYRNHLRAAILRFYDAFKDDYLKVVVHIYDDLPLQISCIVDGEVITSFVTRGSRSRDQIHVRFRPDHFGIATTFIAHFESVFNTSTDLLSYAWVHRTPRDQ